MPAYVYWCDVCNMAETVSHAMHDDSVVEHDCGTPMFRRPSVGGVSFSGPGFYSTDSK